MIRGVRRVESGFLRWIARYLDIFNMGTGFDANWKDSVVSITQDSLISDILFLGGFEIFRIWFFCRLRECCQKNGNRSSSTPNLDRKLASTLTFTPPPHWDNNCGCVLFYFILYILFIQVLILVLVPNMIHEIQLGSGFIDDWLRSVRNWAEDEALQVIGGIVSLKLQAKVVPHVSIYLHSPSLSTRRV